MPAFEGELTEQQIEDVAGYVAENAGGHDRAACHHAPDERGGDQGPGEDRGAGPRDRVEPAAPDPRAHVGPPLARAGGQWSELAFYVDNAGERLGPLVARPGARGAEGLPQGRGGVGRRSGGRTGAEGLTITAGRP